MHAAATLCWIVAKAQSSERLCSTECVEINTYCVWRRQTNAAKVAQDRFWCWNILFTQCHLKIGWVRGVSVCSNMSSTCIACISFDKEVFLRSKANTTWRFFSVVIPLRNVQQIYGKRKRWKYSVLFEIFK